MHAYIIIIIFLNKIIFKVIIKVVVSFLHYISQDLNLHNSIKGISVC